MTKLLPVSFLTLPSGSGVSAKRRFLLYSSNPMFDIIAAMGRYRIKKKEVSIPFRETLAYRLLLVTGSAVVFIVVLYQATRALQAGNTTTAIILGAVSAVATISAFYNLDRARYARVSDRAARRMRRK